MTPLSEEQLKAIEAWAKQLLKGEDAVWDFVADAREHVPTLLAEVRRLRQQIVDLKRNEGWTTCFDASRGPD